MWLRELATSLLKELLSGLRKQQSAISDSMEVSDVAERVSYLIAKGAVVWLKETAVRYQ